VIDSSARTVVRTNVGCSMMVAVMSNFIVVSMMSNFVVVSMMSVVTFMMSVVAMMSEVVDSMIYNMVDVMGTVVESEMSTISAVAVM